MDSITLEQGQDPELYEARRLLIKKMHGESFFDVDFLGKIAYLTPYLFRFPFLVIGCAFLAVAVCIVVSVCAFDTGGLDCRGACEAARTDFEIRLSLLGGFVGAVFFTSRHMYRRESEIRRLRKVPPKALLNTLDAWEEERATTSAILARYDEIEYAARRTGYWTNRYAHNHDAS